MKWMWSTALVLVAAAALSAQSGQDMKMGETMKMKTSYTGCVAAGADGSSFLLTHVSGEHAMMQHDGMMKPDAGMMKADGGMHDGDHDKMSNDVVLTGRSDLKKHVGQKVTVSGSLSRATPEMSTDRDTLTVTALKVVGKSCS